MHLIPFNTVSQCMCCASVLCSVYHASMGATLCRCTNTLLFSTGVFIVAAKRTPFGTYGGVLKDHSATDLAEHAAKAALAAGGVAPELINSVIVGNVMQVQPQ